MISFGLAYGGVVVMECRNNRLFNGEVRNSTDIVKEIKVLSWKWSVDRLKAGTDLH
jgi:hypothetical protein